MVVRPSRGAIRIGSAVAIIADALQLVLFPLFVEGFSSVLNDVLDVVVCAVLLRLIGWNPVFLPTFVVEMLPFGCLLYTSDAADDLLCVDLGGRRIIKKN